MTSDCEVQERKLRGAETAVISRLVGTHVQRLATIAHGDGVCTTHIPGPAPLRPPHPLIRLKTEQNAPMVRTDT